MTTPPIAPTADAYDELAPVYDLLTAGYRHEHWLGELHALAMASGLHGRRMLDVACGTGNSFLPLLRRGFDVTACDVSPAMAERARAKSGGAADVHVADMRRLPALGHFDLVTCLDDAINHLDSEDDLAATFEGVRRNLAPGGVLLFDVTTELAYAGGADLCCEEDGRLVILRGSRARIAGPGDTTEIVIELFTQSPDGSWERTTSRHAHRHHPLASIRAALDAAGLRIVAMRGQLAGGRLVDPADERVHRKVVFAATADQERRLT